MNAWRRSTAWAQLWKTLSRWQRCCLCALLGYSVLHVGYSIYQYNPFVFEASGGDFRATFQGVLDWRRSGSFAAVGGPSNAVYYPPLFYVLLWPLTTVSWATAARLCYLAQWFPLYAAVVWVVKAAAGRQQPTLLAYLAGLMLTVNFQPFLATVAQYKIETFEFVLICGAIYALHRRRDVLAGAAIALAAHLKYLPGILVGYFLLTRERKVLLGVLLGALLVLAVLLPILGPRTLWAFLIEHPLRLLFNSGVEFNRFDASPERQTLGGTIYRWFGVVTPPNTFEYQLRIGIAPLSHPRLAAGIARAAKLLAVGWYLWFITRRRWQTAERATRWPLLLYEISLTLLMIFVVTQGARVHYAILVLPAFVLTGLLLLQGWRQFRWPEKVLFFAAYSLSGWLIPGGLLDRLPPSPVWGRAYANFYLWLSLPFYGFVLLGLCIVLCYRRVLEWQKRTLDQTRRPG